MNIPGLSKDSDEPRPNQYPRNSTARGIQGLNSSQNEPAHILVQIVKSSRPQFTKHPRDDDAGSEEFILAESSVRLDAKDVSASA